MVERRRWRVQEVVRSLAVEWSGTGEVRDPITATSSGTGVEPVAGLRAAVLVRRVAARQEREYALAARGAGWSWSAIGSVLGFEGTDEPDVSAFTQIAGRDERSGAWRESLSWRCTRCGQRVTDTGPYGSHPTDVESGHAEDCARHRPEVTAWQQQARWDD